MDAQVSLPSSLAGGQFRRATASAERGNRYRQRSIEILRRAGWTGEAVTGTGRAPQQGIYSSANAIVAVILFRRYLDEGLDVTGVDRDEVDGWTGKMMMEEGKESEEREGESEKTGGRNGIQFFFPPAPPTCRHRRVIGRAASPHFSWPLLLFVHCIVRWLHRLHYSICLRSIVKYFCLLCVCPTVYMPCGR